MVGIAHLCYTNFKPNCLEKDRKLAKNYVCESNNFLLWIFTCHNILQNCSLQLERLEQDKNWAHRLVI